MRIAVNTRLLLKNKLEGIGWFTYETLKRVTRNHPHDTFYFLFDRPFDNEFIFSENIVPVVISPQARHPFLWYLWFEHSVNHFLKNTKVDAFLSPDGYISLKTNIPQISVIHDINFFHFPKGLPMLTSGYFNHFFPKFASKASRIITVSNASKNDIANCYNVSASKIDVIYNGANHNFKPLTIAEIKSVRNSITNGAPYFLFVGALNPRKNVGRLIDAFDIFKQQHATNAKLVIIGEKMFKTSSINKSYKNCTYKSDIVFAGRKNLDDLVKITASAHGVIYPSLFEGFGIPVLEAMQCNIPLAVSNTTSLPEVAGKAAIYFNPNSVQEITEAMEQIWFNESLRKELVAEGKTQQEKFSWDLSAEKLYDSILKTLNR